jgi:hypothetical protein
MMIAAAAASSWVVGRRRPAVDQAKAGIARHATTMGGASGKQGVDGS